MSILLANICMLFVHWLADFMLQTDWQAKNKYNNWKALFGHVMIYSLVMSLGFAIVGGLSRLHYAILVSGITFITHILIDYFTSKLNHMLWDKKMSHYFFGCVGFDQFIHLSILLICVKQLY